MDEINLTSVIEDPYKDRILFLSKDDKKSNDFFQILIRKGYWVKLLDLSDAIEKELDSYDLICIHLGGSTLTQNLLSDLKNRIFSLSVPVIIVGNIVDLNSEGIPSVTCLPASSTSAEFLVKVQLQIRLRKEHLVSVSEQVSIVSENASLRALTNQFARDMEEAKEIHSRLLPSALPQLRSASLGAIYIPLEAVGGDLYDAWEIDENHVGLFLADVNGHGLPAAFIGAMIKMLSRIEGQTSSSKQLSYIDSVLSKYMPDSRFATAISIVYNQVTHEINVSRAGHTSLLIYRKKLELVEELEPKGPPLTLGALIPFEEIKTTLQDGDQLLVYTDGITEVMNMSGELLGVELLKQEFLRLAKNHGISEVLRLLHDFQEDYSGGRLPKDDLTMLGLEQK